MNLKKNLPLMVISIFMILIFSKLIYDYIEGKQSEKKDSYCSYFFLMDLTNSYYSENNFYPDKSLWVEQVMNDFKKNTCNGNLTIKQGLVFDSYGYSIEYEKVSETVVYMIRRVVKDDLVIEKIQFERGVAIKKYDNNTSASVMKDR